MLASAPVRALLDRQAAVGAAVAAAAGVLSFAAFFLARGTALGPLVWIGGFALLTEPNMAAALGPIVFVVIVVGGLGSISGAFIASMLIGILQTFAVAVDYSLLDLFRTLGISVSPTAALREVYAIKLAQAAPMLPYLLLVLMLIVRPRGLMGTRDT